MSTAFNEGDHPRDNSGEFTRKSHDAPSTTLSAPVVLDEWELCRELGFMAETEEEMADLHGRYLATDDQDGQPVSTYEFFCQEQDNFRFTQIPDPEPGTELTPTQAMTVPGFTAMTIRSEEMSKPARFYARGSIARLGETRRFTNLDNGMEYFFGGEDKIAEATVIPDPSKTR